MMRLDGCNKFNELLMGLNVHPMSEHQKVSHAHSIRILNYRRYVHCLLHAYNYKSRFKVFKLINQQCMRYMPYVRARTHDHWIGSQGLHSIAEAVTQVD